MKTASVFKLLLAAVTGVGIGFLLAPGRSNGMRRKLRTEGADYLRGVTYACRQSLKGLKHVLNPLFEKQSDRETGITEKRKKGEESNALTNSVHTPVNVG